MAAWMFKGNPTIFDINPYLRTTNPITWTLRGPVKRFDLIGVGDRVFMFRAGDGVIAVGHVIGKPRPVGPLEPRVRALWFRFLPKPDDPCIPIEIEEVRLFGPDGMLPIRELRRHPVLAKLSILTAAGPGTTYAVNDEQARALMTLWRERAPSR
jgi:hypothetical protein